MTVIFHLTKTNMKTKTDKLSTRVWGSASGSIWGGEKGIVSLKAEGKGKAQGKRNKRWYASFVAQAQQNIVSLTQCICARHIILLNFASDYCDRILRLMSPSAFFIKLQKRACPIADETACSTKRDWYGAAASRDLLCKEKGLESYGPVDMLKGIVTPF